MKRRRLVASLVTFGFLLACAPSSATKQASSGPKVLDEPVIATDVGKKLTVQVERENVRRVPNGQVLGRLSRGAEITVVQRVGNWIQFDHPNYQGAFIWAPSVGYEYANLYSPYFYYDTTAQEFRNVAYFQRIFSKKGQRRQDLSDTYELFFKDIGLGSHEETVVEVVTPSEQVVEHGVTLYITAASDEIKKVRVDYFRPVKGIENALEKSGMLFTPPNDADNSHLIWKAGTLVPGLIVDLERMEWESDWFSSIWYLLPEVQ